MQYLTPAPDRIGAMGDLFAASFTASEGAQEGQAIAALAQGLITTTQPRGLDLFVAQDGDHFCGAVIFTRLEFPRDARQVWLLSPMAVAPTHQGQGIGTALIAHAKADLRAKSADVIVTYGDPAFYGKSGFAPIAQTILPPPFALSHPEGWIACNLRDDGPIAPFLGPSQCAPALRHPHFW